ncbi:transcription termination factor 5, mitochondrial-like [Pieris rapae]|uniref:transcription termination factor 5, mitochondrial-like n=1 Tax=Pieris rapae TaxID=64459 RepID=UPI001E280354|nr:transcription termination factor 5, mitochondrial-like [Pieris rapae]
MLLGRLKQCCCLQKFMRTISTNHENLYKLCRHLGISKDKAQFIMLKQPYITKFCEEDIQSMVKTVYDLGYPKDILIDYPNLFYMLPVTLKNRYKILEECGFIEITPQLLLSYLNVMKQKTVGELKNSGLIPQFFNTENRLASCMTQWPTSLTTLIYGDINLLTLHSLRLKIIQRYLELVIDLTEDEFLRGLKTYPTLQHRPLKAINETLEILQSQVGMPKYKIKSNLYLIHADPDNLMQILFKLRELGGIDVKDVIRMYPRLAAKNYSTLQEIKDIRLKKHGIGPEAQSRCFQVFSLSPKTVEERLIHAKTTPEFSLYINHPRFLKMILYKTVLKRRINLKNQNKKCLSLNALSGSSVRYDTFEKAPGDRLGKGKDLICAISQVLGSGFPTKNIRNTLRKNLFWINIPLVEVKYV